MQRRKNPCDSPTNFDANVAAAVTDGEHRLKLSMRPHRASAKLPKVPATDLSLRSRLQTCLRPMWLCSIVCKCAVFDITLLSRMGNLQHSHYGAAASTQMVLSWRIDGRIPGLLHRKRSRQLQSQFCLSVKADCSSRGWNFVKIFIREIALPRNLSQNGISLAVMVSY